MSTHQSHATDPAASKVPPKVQQKVPESIERALPNKIHPTADPSKESHDKGHSVVPESTAQALPPKVEQKVPDALHDTSGKKSDPEQIREQAGRPAV